MSGVHVSEVSCGKRRRSQWVLEARWKARSLKEGGGGAEEEEQAVGEVETDMAAYQRGGGKGGGKRANGVIGAGPANASTRGGRGEEGGGEIKERYSRAMSRIHVGIHLETLLGEVS